MEEKEFNDKKEGGKGGEVGKKKRKDVRGGKGNEERYER